MATKKQTEEIEEPKPDTRNIYQRLRGAMLECTYIQKEEMKKGMQYRTVSHDAVTAKVRPALVNHGIVYIVDVLKHECNGNRTEVDIFVNFVNCDNPEDQFGVSGFGYGIDSQDKGPGKALSYAVKYVLLKVMGLETGDDADNESIEYKAGNDYQPGAVPSDDNMTQEQAHLSALASIKKLVKENGWDGPTLRKCIEAEFKTDFDKMTPAQYVDALDWAQSSYIDGKLVDTNE